MNDVDPLFIMYIMLTKTIENDILIVSRIDTCPICGSKLYRDGTDTFKINNTFNIYKQKQQCSNDQCRHNLRPLWEDYFKHGSNYYRKNKRYNTKYGINIKYFLSTNC